MFNNRFTKKDSVVDAVSQVLEAWDDDEDADVKRADAELKRMKAKPIHADKKTDPDKEIGKLAKKTPKEVDEEFEQIDELSKDTLGSYVKKATDAKEKNWQYADAAAKRSKTAADTKQFLKHSEKFGKRTSGLKMAADRMNKEEAVTEDKWTDIADGPWKKSNRSDSSAASAAANAAGKGLKGAQHKLDVAEPKGKLTAADFKKLRKEDSELQEKTLTPAESKKKEEIVKSMKKGVSGFKERYGKRAKEVMYATATKQAKKVAEEVEQMNESHYGDMSHSAKELVLHADNDVHLHHTSHAPIMHNLSKKMKNGTYHPEKAKKLWAYHADRAAQSYAKHHGDGTPWHKMFSTSDRKAAASHWEDMHRHELNESIQEAKGPTSTYGLDTFAQEDSTCGTCGTTGGKTTTPLDRAKELARGAVKRLNNTLMGKAGATSEEIDPNVKTTDTLRGRIKGGKSDDVGPGSDAKSTKVKFTPGPK